MTESVLVCSCMSLCVPFRYDFRLMLATPIFRIVTHNELVNIYFHFRVNLNFSEVQDRIMVSQIFSMGPGRMDACNFKGQDENLEMSEMSGKYLCDHQSPSLPLGLPCANQKVGASGDSLKISINFLLFPVKKHSFP